MFPHEYFKKKLDICFQKPFKDSKSLSRIPLKIKDFEEKI